MRALIQRVKKAKVDAEGETIGKINKGLLVLLGVSGMDGEREIDLLVEKTGLKIEHGRFGAMMDIELVNWGPVTIMLDTQNRI